MAIKIKSISLELMVKNVEESIQFYQHYLSANLIASEKEEGKTVWAHLDFANGNEIGFKEEAKLKNEYHFYKDKTIGGSFSICFLVEGVNDLYKSIKGKAPIVEKLHITTCDLNEFSILDGNGYILTFIEE